MTEKWEYTVVVLENITGKIETQFNQLGQGGWELVGIDRHDQAYFKRPFKEEVAPGAYPPAFVVK